jgi:hypothetical protein
VLHRIKHGARDKQRVWVGMKRINVTYYAPLLGYCALTTPPSLAISLFLIGEKNEQVLISPRGLGRPGTFRKFRTYEEGMNGA